MTRYTSVKFHHSPIISITEFRQKFKMAAVRHIELLLGNGTPHHTRSLATNIDWCST